MMPETGVDMKAWSGRKRSGEAPRRSSLSAASSRSWRAARGSGQNVQRTTGSEGSWWACGCRYSGQHVVPHLQRMFESKYRQVLMNS